MGVIGAFVVVTSLVGSASATAAADAAVLRCLKVLASVAGNDVPVSNEFEPASCTPDTDRAAFRHDAETGFSRTAHALAAGDIVSRFPEYGVDMVRPGQTLQMVVASGAVRIVRQVQAMQAARSGQRLFVQTSDGRVFSAVFEAKP